MDLGISGKVALVTGAGRGIGAEICRTLAADGARIAVNDLFQERADEAANEILSAGGEAIGVTADVTDLASIESAVRRDESELGPVDILVNNAGIPAATTQDAVPATGGFFPESSREDWVRTMGLITYGVLNCSRAVIGGCRSDAGVASSTSSLTPAASASPGWSRTRWRKPASSDSQRLWRRSRAVSP